MKFKRLTVYEVRTPDGHIVDGGNTQSDALFNALRDCTPSELTQYSLCEVILEKVYHDDELIQTREFIQHIYSIHVELLNDPAILDGYRIELR